LPSCLFPESGIVRREFELLSFPWAPPQLHLIDASIQMHMMLSRWLPSLQHGRHSRLGRYILYACRWGKTQLLTLSCVRCLFCNQLMFGGSLLSLSRSRLGSASNKLKHGTANTRTHKHQRSGNQTNAQTFNTIGKLWWRLYFPWPSIAPANFGFEIPMGF